MYLCKSSSSNMLVEPSGPEAGKIVAVLDWEMAATLPLWAVASYPGWFDTPMPGITRKPMDAAACRNTYLAELRRLGHDEAFIRLAQEGERKRRFAEVVALPWYAADALEVWLQANPEIVVPEAIPTGVTLDQRVDVLCVTHARAL
jgi:hypothetical protein